MYSPLGCQLAAKNHKVVKYDETCQRFRLVQQALAVSHEPDNKNVCP